MSPHLCVLAFVLSLAAPAAAQHVPAPRVPRVGFERPDWHLVTPPDRQPLRTRHVATFLATIPAALLFVLHIYRPRRYLLAWCCAWLLLGAMLYGVATSADLIRAGHAGAGGILLGLSRALGIASVVLIVVAPRLARGTVRVPRAATGLALAAWAWLAVSSAVVGVAWTVITSYAALVVLYAAAGIVFLRVARAAGKTGPVVVGVGLVGVATSYVYALTLVAQGAASIEAPNTTVFVSVAWQAVVMLGMHLMVFEDMSAELEATSVQLARTESELHAAAVTDPLTGCYNRRFFTEVVDRELERHRRHRLPLVIMFVDCDNLKGVNDTLGHAAGDEVLQAVARVARAHLRRSDYVFRWGGDEFVVMASCDASHAAAKARSIQEAFRAEPLVRGLSVFTGVSVGCCEVPPDARDLLPFVRRADQRMYADKWQAV